LSKELLELDIAEEEWGDPEEDIPDRGNLTATKI